MFDLTDEEERSLHELVDVYNSGDSVSDFISERLYVELSVEGNPDSFGNRRLIKRKGFDEQMDVYGALADKGFLKASRPAPGKCWFGDLTSAGRCFFMDREKARREKRRELWSMRLWQVIVAILTVVLGIGASVVTSLVMLQLQPGMESAAAEEPFEVSDAGYGLRD